MSVKLPPPNVLALAAALGRGEPVDLPSERGQARTVWLTPGWVLKVPHPWMASEYGPNRRSPAQEAAWFAERGESPHVPATVMVGDVQVQERLAIDPPRAWRERDRLRVLAADLQAPTGDPHPGNIGWREDGTPVFLDVEYLGPPLTVVCLLKLATTQGRAKQGEAPFWHQHGATYLRAMVRNCRQHLPASTRVVAMTDRPDLVPAGCEAVALEGDQPGWWAKLNAFRRDVACGLTMFLDLDNVIAGPLTELLALTPDPIIMLDDRGVPGLPNSSTMLYHAERLRFVWDRFAAEPERWYREFDERVWPICSDQAYITHVVRGAGHTIPFFQDLLPPGYVVQSRYELEAGAPWQRAQLVFGCWTPKPHESRHDFYRLHWRAA
jgi:hypothetical protein